jgi:hypothetical protein
LAHSQSEHGVVSQFPGFWKNVENKAPLLVLIGGTTSSGSSIVFGCYCSKEMPAVVANLAQDADYPVQSSPEDFVFCYIDDNSFHHFAPKPNIPILSMLTDYEGGGGLSVANDFMLMSFSYDYTFTVGTIYDLEKIQVENNPKPAKQVESSGVVFQKFEVWTTTSSAGGLKEASSLGATKPTTFGLGQLQVAAGSEPAFATDFKHAWHSSLSPFVHFRTNPVFMVPSHLTLG